MCGTFKSIQHESDVRLTCCLTFWPDTFLFPLEIWTPKIYYISRTQDISPKNAIKYQNCINVQNVTVMTGIGGTKNNSSNCYIWSLFANMQRYETMSCFWHLLLDKPSDLTAKSLLTVRIIHRRTIQYAINVLSFLKTYAHTVFKALQWCRDVMTASNLFLKHGRIGMRLQ